VKKEVRSAEKTGEKLKAKTDLNSPCLEQRSENHKGPKKIEQRGLGMQRTRSRKRNKRLFHGWPYRRDADLKSKKGVQARKKADLKVEGKTIRSEDT